MKPGETILVKGIKTDPKTGETRVVREFRGRFIKMVQIDDKDGWKVELQNGRSVQFLESEISSDGTVMISWELCRER